MSKHAITLPIREAREFAERKGLEKAVNDIESLRELDGWDEVKVNSAKKGKYVQLFCALGVFEEFKQNHWPSEGAPNNPYSKLFYIIRALDYDEAVRQLAKL